MILFMVTPKGLRSRTSPAGYGAGVDVDSAWEQYKLEARKMLVNGDCEACHLPSQHALY